MRLGPVASSVKDIAEFSNFLDTEELSYASKYLTRGVGNNTLMSIADTDDKLFSESEVEALDFSFGEFGNYPANKLVDITHKYPEWDKFRSALESKETTREPMSYSDFFSNPKDTLEDKFALNPEMLSASKELFEESYQIADYWK
jgi:hypothetical protein